MKKRLLNKIKQMAAGLSLLGAAASAEQVTVSPERGLIRIKFDEPIVSQTVAETARGERYRDKKSSPHDLGLDLFEVTGDPAHQPKVHWEDQNRLLIEPAEGTSVATEFRLAFKPGVTYLSGKALAQREFRFHAPDTRLNAQALDSDRGLPTTGIRVRPEHQVTKEAIEFSASSPVEYTFVQMVRQKDGRLVEHGRKVAGKAEPLLFKHDPDHYNVPYHATPEQLRALGPDTEHPATVLVTPAEPLPYNTEWMLQVTPAEGSGLIACSPCISPAYPELRTAVSDFIGPLDKKGKRQCCKVEVRFSATVTEDAARQAFRDLEISIGGIKSTNSADGKCKTVATPQGTYTFTFDSLTPAGMRGVMNVRMGGSNPANDGWNDWRYSEPDAARGFTIRLDAPAPALAEFTVKPGIASKLGRPLTRDHVHRINLNPAWPAVDLAEDIQESPRLPYRGEHKLRLRSAGSCGITATAYRWDADQALQAVATLHECINADPDALHKYALAVTTLQCRAGLVDKDDFKYARERQIEHSLQHTANAARLQGALAKAHKFQPQQIAVDEKGFCDCTEHVLDLNSLTGGNTAPGLYLVALEIKPSAAVLAAAKAVGVEEKDLTLHTEFPVVVSDLQLTPAGESGILLVTDRRSGKPVESGRAVLKFKYRDDWDRSPKDALAECSVEQGVARPRIELEDAEYSWAEAALVCSGDDCLVEYKSDALSNLRRNMHHTEREDQGCKAALFCDNRLYRPGDTVHVRGVIRRTDNLNNTSLPKLKEAVLTVKKPSGEDLKKETLAVDAFGCVAYDFTLPEGEEDVTGAYRIVLEDEDRRLGDCTVEAQVFRRDSFEHTAKCEMERVAPKDAKLRITATDLNGAPLSNAKLHYRLDSDMQLGCAAMADAALDAKGCFELTVKLSPKEGDTRNAHHLYVSGSITNDREEVRGFSCSASSYSADFRAERDNDVLRLYDTRTAERTILAREQKLHVALKGRDTVERIDLPNGFTARRSGEVTVWEGDVTVPANAELGLPLQLKERIDAYKKGREESSLKDIKLTIAGTDPEGRSFADTSSIWEYQLRRSAHEPEFSLRTGQDRGSCTLRSELSGTALAVVSSGAYTLRPQLLEVEYGEHAVDLKLTPQETGKVRVLLVMPVKDKDGLYSQFVCDDIELTVPNPQRKLQVKLDLPQDACRPGAETKLGGTVSLQDGAPAAAAVTLFAVDEGMLSLSSYSMPDLEDWFNLSPRSVHMYVSRGYRDDDDEEPNDILELMEGVWNGVCVSLKDDNGGGPFGHRVPNSIRRRSSKMRGSGDFNAVQLEAAPAAAVPCVMVDGSAGDEEEGDADAGDSNAYAVAKSACYGKAAAPPAATQKPRLRTNFVPVAVWKASLPVDAQGRFETTCTLPDTLTSYRVFAVAVDDSGNRFGGAEGRLQVNQPVMLTPGTPFFMSTGDRLLLPLTVTNNTDAAGTWKVQLDATADTQEIRLEARATGTLVFEVEAREEGTCKLNWTATADGGADAVQGTFPVRFPAPLLKEAHHLVLAKDAETLRPAALLAPELAGSARGEMEIALSANPLLHLAGCVDYVLDYPYGCTEQTATGLLPWLLYDRLAPICPRMAETTPAQAHKLVEKSIEKILRRQRKDGGLGYWDDAPESCLWASAHAALVLDIATACGYELPKGKWNSLCDYLRKESKHEKYRERTDATTRFEIARVLRDDAGVKRALKELVREDDKAQEDASWFVSMWHPRSVQADLRLIADMEKNPAKRHGAFISWLRARGHDYRHTTTWQSSWTLIALHEYLRREPAANMPATVTTADGSKMTLGNTITTVSLVKRGDKLGDCAAAYSCTDGTAYAIVRAKAQPEQTEYPGVTEKGLQVTRLYEKKDADGVWRPARDFRVGDVVRVTLTCAKPAKDLEYFVLEDYLPSCMEALNPAIPSQCVGLERCDWSVWFDHKEYLADRVRGFCTKWGGRDLLNMRYYARVKRAGTSTAPPAQAQLMYEPQTYGLSPNTVITSK